MREQINELRKVEIPLSPEEISRIIIDPHSFITSDNAIATKTRLLGINGQGPWSIHLVTNDWHIPRALLIFMQEVVVVVAVSITTVAVRNIFERTTKVWFGFKTDNFGR